MKMGGGVGNPTSLMKGNVGLATPPHQVWVTAKREHGVGNPRWGWLPQGLGPLTGLRAAIVASTSKVTDRRLLCTHLVSPGQVCDGQWSLGVAILSR